METFITILMIYLAIGWLNVGYLVVSGTFAKTINEFQDRSSLFIVIGTLAYIVVWLPVTVMSVKEKIFHE